MSCEAVVLVQDGSFRCAGGETRLSFLVVGVGPPIWSLREGHAGEP